MIEQFFSSLMMYMHLFTISSFAIFILRISDMGVGGMRALEMIYKKN